MAKGKPAATRGTDNDYLIALAYDRNGKMIARAPVENQTADLGLKPEELRYSRVFILPVPPDEKDAPRLDDLSMAEAERRVSYEPVIRINENNRLDIGTIPDYIVNRWLWARCCVQGTVTKNFIIDGISQSRPVCNAIVHICEVDRVPLIIRQIPDWVIDRFREELLYPIPQPIPIPDPRPDFEPQPGPFPTPFRQANFSANFADTATPIRLEMQQNTQSNTNLLISNQLASQVRLASTERFRQLLTTEYATFYPIFCYYPFIWPYVYRCDEMSVTRTDHNGRYQGCFWYQRFSDQPDVYVWVQYEIGGVPVTVYRPSIACHTRWNYNCGDNIDIKISDSRVPMACDRPLEGAIVWVKSIGSNAHISRIEQNEGAFINLTHGGTLRTVGLTDLGTSGLGDGMGGKKVRPFATSFPLVVQFGSELPGSNVTHYLWSYRKMKNDKLVNASATEREWKPLDSTAISKGYTIEVIRPDGVKVFKTLQYPLGPVAVGSNHAYKIPPVSPKGSPVNGGPTAEWNQNTTTMVINTTSLDGDGLYEFKLEFFNNAGVRQNVADTVNQVSNPADLSESQPAGPSFLLPTSEDPFRPFRMKMRLDNQKCEAAIYPVAIGGRSAGTECGFLAYGSSTQIDIRFKADHPNGFGYFSWAINRGYSGSTNGSTSGAVKDNTANYYQIGGGIYRNNASIVTVGSLLGTCDKAAFAQSLHVDGLHTNGSSVLNDFDAGGLAAFALEP